MVYVLVPAHNNRQEVIDLLHCLFQQTYAQLQTILVDDGSTDGTAAEVRRLFPDVIILFGDGSLWWAGANVLGVEHILARAQGDDYVLLLNNDVLVEADYVNKLVICSRQAGRALVGSTVVDSQDAVRMWAGVRLDHRLRITEQTDVAIIETTDYDDHVDVLSGRGTLIPVEVFRKIGTFNEARLPHYGADYEFSIRARRAGFKLLVSHRAKVRGKLEITGLHLLGTTKLTARECFALLFARKSAANVYYYLTYIWLCSEKDWRIRNVISHGIGVVMDSLEKTVLGWPVARGLRCLVSCAGGSRHK